MTTKAIMIARIGSELRRGTSINTQIGAAIDTACKAYLAERLFKKDSRQTLSTVVNQGAYTVADQPWLGLVSRLDWLALNVGGIAFPMTRKSDEWMNSATVAGANGQPYHWSWFAETLRLFPVPSNVWTLTVAGNFEVAGPASDGETGNSWMTEGENLIRNRAKFELYLHVLANPQRAAIFSPEDPKSPTSTALNILQKRTTAKVATGRVAPWGL